MMRLRRFLLLFVVAACGAGGFESQSVIDSVRMLGVRADKPYAKPGETVELELLAADGRKDQRRPLKFYWLPIVCVNPREDLYYACFAPQQATLQTPFPVDAGAAPAAGGLAGLPTGVDLGPFLPQGTTFQFRMPDGAIKERPGAPPYGLAIIFNIACTGQVRFVPPTGGNPQQLPIQCTDESGTQLPPSDYVIGIDRVYSYTDRTNANPVVERITLDGFSVDPAVGITVDRCVAKRRADCPKVKIDVKVSDASWELNPGENGGGDQHEQIWVTYYSNLGTFGGDARLLFDARKGRVSESDVDFRAPYEPGDGTLWAVIHDNRAGAAFVTLPLHVR